MSVETIYEQDDGSIISEIATGRIDIRKTSVTVHPDWDDYREHLDQPVFTSDMISLSYETNKTASLVSRLLNKVLGKNFR